MPHLRPRLVLDILLKRARLWPVVGVIGVRQSGKSVLLRELLAPKLKARYSTMDSLTQRKRAETSPEGFTEPESKLQTLIIDEIQKVPELFDSIKLHVDRNRRPGLFIVSGSSEFSRFTGIRESLTGRIGIVHLHPLTLSELHAKPLGRYLIDGKPAKAQIKLADFERRLNRGGMPGMAFLRSDEEFQQASAMWIETTCYRDLQQVQGRGFDGELALDVLRELVCAPEPTLAHVAKSVRRDARVIHRYLEAFQRILVLQRLTPHETGVGKDHYVLCDVGLAAHLGASRETLLRTHLLQEALALSEMAGREHPRIQYYRNERSSRVPIILSWGRGKAAPEPLAIQFGDAEAPSRGEIASLRAFAERNSTTAFRYVLLTQTTESYREGNIEVHPLRG